MPKDIGQAILETLISPNEADRNMENANVVDGLFAIARGLQAIATQMEVANSRAPFSPSSLLNEVERRTFGGEGGI